MTQSMPGLLIALSAGGKPQELAAQGLGIEHVRELMVRLSMKLLRNGHRLAFGGILGRDDQSLTEALIDTAQNWLDEGSAKECDVTRPETWPLTSYSAWPFYTSISQEQRARLVSICRFVNVDLNGVDKSSLGDAVEKWYDNPQARRYVADALTAMRERSAKEADLRIVWGGTIEGAKGWMAGILEEVACSLAHNKPILILGGFGGCARLLADFLSDMSAPWPVELSLAACADAERDGLLTDSQRESLNERFEKTKAQLDDFRSRLHRDESTNGIPSKLARDALQEETARSVIRAAATAAKSDSGVGSNVPSKATSE